MKVKATVIIPGSSFEIGWACGVADLLYRDRFNKELVVTSVKDSQHHVGSLHYVGRAADLRIRDLLPAEQATFTQLLKVKLNPHGFDVVLEANHIHIEFDPKAGERFAEVTA